MLGLRASSIRLVLERAVPLESLAVVGSTLARFQDRIKMILATCV